MDQSNVTVVDFGPDGNCTLDLCPLSASVYGYRPSLAANITFIALFALAMLIHAIIGIWWKTWWFMICVIVGCLDEIIGYVGRVLMYRNPFSFDAFMIQIVCITCGPVFFCAAIYVTLAQTIINLDISLARFSPRLMYWIFVPCDLVSLVLQAAGGAMSTASSGDSELGTNIALAGLAFQVFTLVIFIGFFVDFLVRLLRRHRGRTTVLRGRTTVFLAFLGIAILLTLIRCAYRVDELSEGYSGPMMKKEGVFIGLEGVLIVTATFALCIGHPGLVFSERAQKKEDGYLLQSVPRSGGTGKLPAWARGKDIPETSE